MFSDNNKISGRQLKRLIVMDWIGKAGLLLPRFTEKADGRSFMLSLLLGIGLTFVYACMVGWLSRHVDTDFYGYIRERLGLGAAWLAGILYICYAFVNTVFMIRLFAVIASLFMLPETAHILLMLMVLAGGYFIAAGGLEVRARVGEILYGIVLYPLALMLLFAAFSINPEYLGPGNASYSVQTLKHGLQMFIAFGGMGIFLFIAPYVNRREKMGYYLKKAVVVSCSSVFFIFLISIGAFGESGMRALAWPALTLMSSAKIPGGFLQRWDVIFTGLLLVSFFISVGTGLFYMRFLTERVLAKKSSAYLPVLTLLALAASVWCGSYETAAQVFTVVNGYILVPVAVLFTIFLIVLEYVKGRRKG